MEVHDVRKERMWRDLSMRKLPLNLVLPNTASRVFPVRRARGGLSVGRGVGARDHGPVSWRRPRNPESGVAWLREMPK